MSGRNYHFALTEAQTSALIEMVNGLAGSIKGRSPLETASIALDEQMAKQDAPWERCPTCKGSGWVEDET